MIDAQIKAAQERLHRSIGQRARRAHEGIRRMADEARRGLRTQQEVADILREAKNPYGRSALSREWLRPPLPRMLGAPL